MRAVVFDWGGTLTPFHQIDLLDLWRVAAAVLAPQRREELAQALHQAEHDWWRVAVETGGSGTTHDVIAAACRATGIDAEPLLCDDALRGYLTAWTEHTYTDPAARPLLVELRRRGLRLGLLSNTHWPRSWHEQWLRRDGVIDSFDARVYTSELSHVKPWPEAFRAVLGQLGVDDPAAAVMVGDRKHDDIHGAKSVGMRTIWLRNQAVPGYDVVPDAEVDGLAEVLAVIDGWTTG
jgi:putative hydrolase of the HAD superfamily